MAEQRYPLSKRFGPSPRIRAVSPLALRGSVGQQCSMTPGDSAVCSWEFIAEVHDPRARNTPILASVNDASPPGSEPGTAPDPNSRTGPIDRRFTQRLLATAAGSEDPTYRALIDGLGGENETLNSILEEVLSDPARLAAVRKTGLLDDVSNPALERIVALTAEALGTHNAAISVIDRDRQILIGSKLEDDSVSRSAPLGESICKFAVASGEPLIVDDTTTHPLLADHPKVTDGSVRAYAGILLADNEGHAIGTLCTWDIRPRRWTSGQVQILNDLAQVVRTKVFHDLPDEFNQNSSIYSTGKRRRRL